jgi:hypothetical protein
MLRLDRVGTVIAAPLAEDVDALEIEDPAIVAALKRAQAPYEGVEIRVEMIDRAEAITFSDQMRRVRMETRAGPVSAERTKAIRADLRAMVVRMLRAIPGVEIGGQVLDELDPEARALAIEQASILSMLADVAARCLTLQSPTRAVKNSSASSPSPSVDASPTSGA